MATQLLWADGSTSFIWECDLQDDSPATYQRYMKEITTTSNQQPTPEPEPEPDSETDSEPEPPPPSSTASKNDERLQRRLRRAAANGDRCPGSLHTSLTATESAELETMATSEEAEKSITTTATPPLLQLSSVCLV